MKTAHSLHRTLVPLREEFLIRRARQADMPRIAGFIRSTAEWYRKFVDPADMKEHEVDEAWERRNFLKREFFLAVAGSKPVGTLSMQTFGDYAYLGYIYLDARCVGKGYGKRLMEFAESRARKRGLKGLVLIAHPEATWATKAYLKFGFERIESTREGVLAWQDGILEDYYEEGFDLYTYEFADRFLTAAG